jgi:hypothetical protein
MLFAVGSKAKIAVKEIFLHPATVWAALGLSTGAAVYYNEEIEKYNIGDQNTPIICQ